MAQPVLELLPASANAFGRLVEPYRPELLVHCYRMLGSVDDAEDAVQDALVRAWKARSSFVRDVSLRGWLYRIATTSSLDAIARRSRRRGEASLEVEPIPDGLLVAADIGPEARAELRESVSLAFLRALQLLPPRQRAALILRDVLGWRVDEIAELLETTVAGVNSALQRARSSRDRRIGTPGNAAAPPPEGALAHLVERYVRAWEAADVEALVALLRSDAVLRMPPRPTVHGAPAIGAFIGTDVLVAGGPNRLIAVAANGGQAFLVVGPAAPGGDPRPFAVLVLIADESGAAIATIEASARPSLVARFASAAGLGA